MQFRLSEVITVVGTELVSSRAGHRRSVAIFHLRSDGQASVLKHTVGAKSGIFTSQ